MACRPPLRPLGHQSAPFHRDEPVPGSRGTWNQARVGYSSDTVRKLGWMTDSNLPEFVGNLPEFVPEFVRFGLLLGVGGRTVLALPSLIQVRITSGQFLLVCMNQSRNFGATAITASDLHGLRVGSGIRPGIRRNSSRFGLLLGAGEACNFDSPGLDTGPNQFGSILSVKYGPAP